MKIGIIIGRIGGVDGVALETEKWIEVLHRMGHEVFLLSGLYQEQIIDSDHEDFLSELSFFSPQCQWEQDKAFFSPDPILGSLLAGIERTALQIRDTILRWIGDKEIEFLISENASALPCHMSMGWGVKMAVEQSGVRTLAHDHDYAWERGSRYISQHEEVNDFVEQIFPLIAPNVTHAVINLEAQQVMKREFSVDSYLVPNVMDFDQPFAEADEGNNRLRDDLGMSKEDILLFQITRVVRRKGIETAIRLIDRLADERFKLIVTGNHGDDEGGVYYSELLELVHSLNLEKQVRFCADRFGTERKTGPSGKSVYDLGDAYARADACTYFSTYEGFGNAFVEALLARKPVFVNNYKPVFWPDIGSKGFRLVMLEDNELSDQAVDEIKETLLNRSLCQEIGEFNFELGKRHFSYEVLEERLQEIVGAAQS